MTELVKFRISGTLLDANKWVGMMEDREAQVEQGLAKGKTSNAHKEALVWQRILAALKDADPVRKGRGIVYVVELDATAANYLYDDVLHVWEYEATDAFGVDDGDYYVARAAAKVCVQYLNAFPDAAKNPHKTTAAFLQSRWGKRVTAK